MEVRAYRCQPGVPYGRASAAVVPQGKRHGLWPPRVEATTAALTRILSNQSPQVLQEAVRLFRKSYLQLEQFPLYPGIPGILKQYQGRKIAVATNKPAPLADYSVQKAGIARYIDVVAADTGDVPLKPAPDLLFLVLRKLKMKASEAVMIGDSVVDILAGKAAGMLTCGVTCGIGSPEAVWDAGPDYLVGNPGELIKLIP